MKEYKGKTSRLSKIAATFTVILAVTILYGCGGGGGGGGTNPETVFPLNEINFDAPQGYKAAFSGPGTITIEGMIYNVTGTYNIEVLDNEYLEDYATLATPVETLLFITVTETGENLSIPTTTYISVPSEENPQAEPILQVIEEPDGAFDTLSPGEFNPLPEVGQVGDSGKVTSWVYDNGDTISGTWELKSAQPGFIYLEINYDYKDPGGGLLSVETDTYTIDEEGTIVSVQVIAHDIENDILIELSADRK